MVSRNGTRSAPHGSPAGPGRPPTGGAPDSNQLRHCPGRRSLSSTGCLHLRWQTQVTPLVGRPVRRAPEPDGGDGRILAAPVRRAKEVRNALVTPWSEVTVLIGSAGVGPGATMRQSGR